MLLSVSEWLDSCKFDMSGYGCDERNYVDILNINAEGNILVAL